MDLNKDVPDISFIENLLGLIYTCKKINKAVSLIDLISKEQVEKIEKTLEELVNKTIMSDENLLKSLNEIKEKISGKE